MQILTIYVYIFIWMLESFYKYCIHLLVTIIILIYPTNIGGATCDVIRFSYYYVSSNIYIVE